jgi:ribosomal-protein-alanine N-acetyltransferase
MKTEGLLRFAVGRFARMQTIKAAELVLEPLTVAHADTMFALLSDPQIYRFLDYGPPPSVEHLRDVYAKLEPRKSPDGNQRWLNWVVYRRGAEPIGYVQATLCRPATAWVAYVLAGKYWGHGYARIATLAMIEHLAGAYGTNQYLATVEAENRRSISLLERLSFRPCAPQEARHYDLSTTERLFVR